MADDPTVLERVQELTWALVDEDITDDELTLLDNLLLSDESARRRYINCAQLHADLLLHYNPPSRAATNETTASMSPVLGFLNAGNPPAGFDSPSTGELN